MIAKVYSTKISERWEPCSCGENKECHESYPDKPAIYVINSGKDTYIGKSNEPRTRIQVHLNKWADNNSDVHLFYLTENSRVELEALEQNLITYCFKNTTWNLRNKATRHKNYIKSGDLRSSGWNSRSTPYPYLPEEYKDSILRIIDYVSGYFIEEQEEFELYQQQEFILKETYWWSKPELVLP